MTTAKFVKSNIYMLIVLINEIYLVNLTVVSQQQLPLPPPIDLHEITLDSVNQSNEPNNSTNSQAKGSTTSVDEIIEMYGAIVEEQPSLLYNRNTSSPLVVAKNERYNWFVLSLSLFSIFGMFGNVLVCMTIRRDPALQTKTNYYLFSLAIADLAVCLIVIPLSIIQDFSGKMAETASPFRF
jgi:hypothetical protein